MSKRMTTKELAEQLALSLDELFEQVGGLKAELEDLKKQVEARDTTNLMLVKTTERLVQEKEFLLKYIGLNSIVQKQKEPVKVVPDLTTTEGRDRFLADLGKRIRSFDN